MYGYGNATGLVLGTGTGVVAATTLPVTGTNWVVDLALAAAAGLAVWAMVYVLNTKLNKR